MFVHVVIPLDACLIDNHITSPLPYDAHISFQESYYVNSGALNPALINTPSYVSQSAVTANGMFVEVHNVSDKTSALTEDLHIMLEKVIEVCISV